VALNALKDIIDAGGRDDREIARWEPLVVRVAGHPITVSAFTIDNYERWAIIMGTTLHTFPKILETLEWPETPKGIQKVRQAWMLAISQRALQREMMSMIERTIFRERGNFWWRWHKRWFRRHVTVGELIDLFFYAYLFNHEAVKKNVEFLLRRMGFVRKKVTFLSSSAENLAGMSGAQVKPRFPVPPYSPSAPQNSTMSSRRCPPPLPVEGGR